MGNHKKQERIIKGVANHWRIAIIYALARYAPMSVYSITEFLGGHLQTIGEHLRKLTNAGLVTKRYRGTTVLHTLTLRGKTILEFLKMLE